MILTVANVTGDMAVAAIVGGGTKSARSSSGSGGEPSMDPDPGRS
jgi:hypothetical protein